MNVECRYLQQVLYIYRPGCEARSHLEVSRSRGRAKPPRSDVFFFFFLSSPFRSTTPSLHPRPPIFLALSLAKKSGMILCFNRVFCFWKLRPIAELHSIFFDRVLKSLSCPPTRYSDWSASKLGLATSVLQESPGRN